MASPGEVLQFIRAGQASTRADLGRLTGLSRTAVTKRVDTLLDLGLVAEHEPSSSTGGRPPGTISFRADAGLVTGIAIGRSRVQLAVADLAGRLLVTEDHDRELTSGPDETMSFVLRRLKVMLRQAGGGDVWGYGCTIPGNVDYARGAGINSQILVGWGGVELAPYLQKLGDAPVYVDNDANMLALSERQGHMRDHPNLVALKASTGLGLGLVSASRLVRGGRAAAGELGHLRTPEAEGIVCRCGETGCLEAIAGGWALVREFNASGRSVQHIRELVACANEGDADARSLIREAGRRIGRALTNAVALLNPDAVVLGGDMAAASDVLVAGVKETIFDDLPAAAGQHLQILPSTYGEQAGVVGCAQLVIERVVGRRAVDRAADRL